MNLRHPRYSDGSPVLIGDVITVVRGHPFAAYIVGKPIVEIGWMPGFYVEGRLVEAYPCVHAAGHTAVVLREGDYELAGKAVGEGDQA